MICGLKPQVIFLEPELPIEMKPVFFYATNGERGKLLFLVRSEQLLKRLKDLLSQGVLWVHIRCTNIGKMLFKSQTDGQW